MEDFNITSQDEGYNYSNITSNYPEYVNAMFIKYVLTCIIISIGLPLTLVAIYAVYSLVRKDHVAPIYVINLLISDLIQLCCLITEVARHEDKRMRKLVSYFHDFGLVASVCFMVCIALERYLVIACPLWYRFRRTIKTSVVICVVVWALPTLYLLMFYFWVHAIVSNILIISFVFFLLPLPLLIFLLGGTLKALSASQLPTHEKRRIVGTLVLVLLIYMLLFLPRIIWFLAGDTRYNLTFAVMCSVLIRLSPLADTALYVFMRKGAIDKVLASVCCCKMDSDDMSVSAE